MLIQLTVESHAGRDEDKQVQVERLFSSALIVVASWAWTSRFRCEECILDSRYHQLTTDPAFRGRTITQRIAAGRDLVDAYAREHWVFVSIQLAILSAFFFWYLHHRFPLDPTAYAPANQHKMDSVKATVADAAVKTVDTLAPKPDQAQLDPPKDTPFTKAELSKYDGRTPDTPIYVAIKGQVFDVSAKRDMYGPGCGYHIFTGKDASKALGKSSLKAEDADSDYSSLTAEEKGVLDDWEKYFTKRYNIIGKVVD
ncbi:cytochrome b5-like heme/steroid binding domain-containing protein [Sporobolomyces koalae]|uniref:cytochrome b5-like heme/steroid binding domain-containing protein n=1 Tax=Sporobolomyces koalae TaxID=500713 RepID=UPI003173431D